MDITEDTEVIFKIYFFSSEKSPKIILKKGSCNLKQKEMYLVHNKKK